MQQRIIGALRARVESRFPRFRNRFKNVRATVSFSLSLSHLGSPPHGAILIKRAVSNGCLLRRRILAHLYLAVLSGRKARNPERLLLFLFHSSSPSFPTKSRSRGSFLVNIAVSSKRLEYGKSTSLLSPIGSSTGLYTARI